MSESTPYLHVGHFRNAAYYNVVAAELIVVGRARTKQTKAPHILAVIFIYDLVIRTFSPASSMWEYHVQDPLKPRGSCVCGPPYL